MKVREQYTVIDVISVNGSKVLVLDRKRELSRADDLYFIMDNNKYPFRLTYNENWIIVDSDVDFLNKKIEL